MVQVFLFVLLPFLESFPWYILDLKIDLRLRWVAMATWLNNDGVSLSNQTIKPPEFVYGSNRLQIWVPDACFEVSFLSCDSEWWRTYWVYWNTVVTPANVVHWSFLQLNKMWESTQIVIDGRSTWGITDNKIALLQLNSRSLRKQLSNTVTASAIASGLQSVGELTDQGNGGVCFDNELHFNTSNHPPLTVGSSMPSQHPFLYDLVNSISKLFSTRG